MSALEEYRVFLNDYLDNAGYRTNAERRRSGQPPNPPGTYRKFQAAASAAYRATKGLPPKPFFPQDLF